MWALSGLCYFVCFIVICVILGMIVSSSGLWVYWCLGYSGLNCVALDLMLGVLVWVWQF